MAINTLVNPTDPSTTAAPQHGTIGSVNSKDGATIGYRQFGHGPGLVLMHGSMSSGYNHVQLAEALADAFTVYVPDRRGRGLSSPYNHDYRIQQDVDDLDTLLIQTGAHNVFGLSSGAALCLQAALTLPALHKLALYEPPLFANQAEPTAVLTRFDQEMAEGRVSAALVTGMKGAQMGPPIFNLMPRRLLERFTNMGMNREAKQESGDYVPMRELAPTLHYDFQLIAEMSGNLERFRAIDAEVLLMGGSKSPAFLKTTLDMLEKILPRAKRVEFPGLGHEASWNTDRGGQPEPVAQALRRFFA